MTDLTVVVAAYRPGPSLLHLVRTVSSEYETVVIDDGSGPDYDPVLNAAEEAGARILRQPGNTGIAASLNAGLVAAFEAGAGAAITFDQDSHPAGGTLARMLAAHRRVLADGDEVGLFVPATFAGIAQTRGDAPLADARRVIQSGMLIPARTADRLGLLKEDLFIDLVDTEYELRALAAGLRVVAVRGTSIGHELGSSLRLLPFGPRVRALGIRTMVSSPFRYYYRVRNRVALTREYGRRMPLRLATEGALELVYTVVVGLSARPRRLFARIVWRGLRDGMRRRNGRMDPLLERQAAAITWSAEPSGVR